MCTPNKNIATAVCVVLCGHYRHFPKQVCGKIREFVTLGHYMRETDADVKGLRQEVQDAINNVAETLDKVLVREKVSSLASSSSSSSRYSLGLTIINNIF